MRTSHQEGRTPTIRQFVMVIVALTWIAVLLPVGVRAAGSLVTLIDPSTSTKARVEDRGALRVAEYNDPARLPVRRANSATVPSGGDKAAVPLIIAPDGYELVIDTVSVWAALPPGQRPASVYLDYHHGPGIRDVGILFIPMFFMGTSPASGVNPAQDIFQGALAVQLNVDPGESVRGWFHRSSFSGTGDADFHFSGHLVRL